MIFFSFKTNSSLIFKPLLANTLLASLLDDKILFLDKNSIKLTPSFISDALILMCGKSEPKTFFSKVSLAVFSAILEAFLPCRISVALLAKIILSLLISFSLSLILFISSVSISVK